MQILPVNAQPYTPIALVPLGKPSKSRKTKRAKKKSKAQLLEDGLKADSFTDVPVIQLDPPTPEDDMSQYIYWNMQAPVEAQDINQTRLSTQIETARQIVEAYRGIPRAGFATPPVTQSFKHLTLPEALIYHQLLDNPPTATQFSIYLDPMRNNPPLWKIQCVLSSPKAKITSKIGLNYNAKTLQTAIHSTQKKTGQLRYIVRGRRLEEITGTYLGKKILLDPVWHPKRRGQLVTEHLRFGTQKIDLAYYQNEKNAVWTHQGAPKKFKSTPFQAYRRDHNLLVVQKQIQLGHYSGKITLIFGKGILMPISGQFSFNVRKTRPGPLHGLRSYHPDST